MKWQNARIHYPDSWLLIEAIQAHTTPEKRRVIDKLAVIEPFDDFFDAMELYKTLHREKPNREMYVIHTINEEIVIKERYWTGIRSIQ